MSPSRHSGTTIGSHDLLRTISLEQLHNRLSSPLTGFRESWSVATWPRRGWSSTPSTARSSSTASTCSTPRSGVPERPGVIAETSFVGPGMRHHPALSYIPSRLSLAPLLFERTLPPDVVVLHCAPPREGLLSLGVEVNVLPAALEACRARGGLVIAVINSRMPYTFGDSQIAARPRRPRGGDGLRARRPRTPALLMTPVS